MTCARCERLEIDRLARELEDVRLDALRRSAEIARLARELEEVRVDVARRERGLTRLRSG